MSTSFLSHYLSTPRRAVSGRINHVVVVGAGLSGLSAAVLLAGSGRSVTVVEKADHVGGRAATETISTPLGDVRVDTGATVVT
ncbi:MAG TPA: FAD-dependent oxidoreductase, partial [Corynebacterium kroppenstedtii]|nr:FAD-dependent oxidoreductase [Corynebacterium kroppenstedtii]